VRGWRGGAPLTERREEWKRVVARGRFRITLNLNLGEGRARVLTTDLSEGYVNFNKSE